MKSQKCSFHHEACSESVSDLSEKLSSLLSEHKGRILIYTGAGISTSAKIPDYRGTDGLYKKLSKRQIVTSKIRLPEATTAKPTYTHMAIKVLVDNGYIRHVVSQNIDGLHVRSGIPLENLTEIHGNLFNEKCQACQSVIYRDFDAAELTEQKNHFTGRICPSCCDMQTAASLRSSLLTSAQNFRDRNNATKLSIGHLKKAAELLSDKFAKEHGRTAPLLQDTLIHYKEFYNFENRDRVLRSLYGTSLFASLFPDRGSRSVKDKNDKQDGPKSLNPTASTSSHKSTCAGSSCSDATTVPSHDEPATLILAIGSSLTVMGSYLHFWPFQSGVPTSSKEIRIPPPSKRPCLDPDLSQVIGEADGGDDGSYTCDYAIINLQKTPIDKYAVFVCRLSCDDILKATLDRLGITVTPYDESTDPLKYLAVPLLEDELATKSRKGLFDH